MQMADAGVAAATDFDWASQMRFYWRGDDETGHLKVRLPVQNAVLRKGGESRKPRQPGAGQIAKVFVLLLGNVKTRMAYFSTKYGADDDYVLLFTPFGAREQLI